MTITAADRERAEKWYLRRHGRPCDDIVVFDMLEVDFDGLAAEFAAVRAEEAEKVVERIEQGIAAVSRCLLAAEAERVKWLCAGVCKSRSVQHGASADKWAECGQGQTSGFCQIREHESRDCAVAIEVLDLREKP